MYAIKRGIINSEIRRRFEKFTEAKKITGKQKKELEKKLEEIIARSMFEPGEAIGVITAQSISEPATQMTMRSYHTGLQSGLTKVTLGLPRMIEIFDARKSFQKSMTIYLKKEYDTEEKAKKVAVKIKETTVGDMVARSSIDLLNMQLELELKKEVDHDTLRNIVKKISKKTEVSFRGNKVFIKPKNANIKDLRNLKIKLLEAHLSGIKGLERLAVILKKGRWVIQTTGSNLKEVLLLDEVDIENTTTNDIYDIENVLGIEAARNAILREAKKTLEEQGLDVDIRHLMLVSDIMTANGKIRSIGRYGVSGQKGSVLARANFEETIKHLTLASFYGETDELKGVVENVMIGKVAPIGTGLIKLTVNPEKLKK